jgi:hypothetical protein
LLRVGLPDLLQWPHDVLLLYAEFLATEPAPEQRIEYALAHLTQTTVNLQRAPNAQPQELAAFLMFKDPWAPIEKAGRITAAERVMVERLRGRARAAQAFAAQDESQ